MSDSFFLTKEIPLRDGDEGWKPELTAQFPGELVCQTEHAELKIGQAPTSIPCALSWLFSVEAASLVLGVVTT